MSHQHESEVPTPNLMSAETGQCTIRGTGVAGSESTRLTLGMYTIVFKLKRKIVPKLRT